jgi:hypothetical protein
VVAVGVITDRVGHLVGGVIRGFQSPRPTYAAGELALEYGRVRMVSVTS